MPDGIEPEKHEKLVELLRVDAEVARYIARLENQAIYDGLTGLMNDRGFLIACNRLISDADGENSCFAFLLFDVDNLKPINDHHGHAAGDNLLKTLASILRRSVRPDDIVCRYRQGDEFAVLLPEMNLEAGVGIAERIAKQMAGTPVRAYERLRIEASIGVCDYPSEGLPVLKDRRNPKEGEIEEVRMYLEKIADSALLFAKEVDDATGAPTVDPTQVASVQFVIRGESFAQARSGTGTVQYQRDTLATKVTLRG